MFARIPVPLKSAEDGTQFDDARIRKAFQDLGFETRYDPDKIDEETGLIHTPTKGDTKVEIGSTAHHRDLAKRNINPDAPANVKSEIERFCIFTGASTIFQANLFITRVNTGEITIWCHQESLDKLIPFCQKIASTFSIGTISQIINLNELKSSSDTFRIISGKAGSVISHGSLEFGKAWRLFNRRLTDIGLLCFSMLIFLITFGLHATKKYETKIDNKRIMVDPLGDSVRAFVENTWPPSFVAALTISLTLAISYFLLPNQKIK
jgi:hypothetical protein